MTRLRVLAQVLVRFDVDMTTTVFRYYYVAQHPRANYFDLLETDWGLRI